MPKTVSAESEPVNADSFLDIVASVVSIMIIMVLMVGLRIKNGPAELPPDNPAAKATGDLAAKLCSEQSLSSDILKCTDKIQQLQQEAVLRQRHRDAMALEVAALERRLDPNHSPTGSPTPEQIELERKVSEAKMQLEQLTRQWVTAETAPAEVVQLTSYPTPLSQRVEGAELEFRLRGNRLALIPMDRLREQLTAEMKRQMYKLEERPEYTETIGPEGGFCLRYTIVRRNFTPDEARRRGGMGYYAWLKQCTLIPVADDLGEAVEDALRPGSQFQRVLAAARADHPVVTIWTYPEGFAAFRRLKEELYRLGFATAARPLPPDTPIGFSPEGSKSAAE
jgi:hypothetical protein